MSICSVAQGLIIRKARARKPAKINEARRLLREYVRKCSYCQKMLKKRKS